MKLKINYLLFLTLNCFCLIKLNDSYNVYKSSGSINSVSLEEISRISNDRINNIKLKMPQQPIFDDSEREEIIIIDEKPQMIRPKYVALTFDDCLSSNTEELLDVLKENDSKATFFVQGRNIDSNEIKLRKIVDDENEIGVQGYNNTPFTNLDIKKINSDLDYTSDKVYDVAGIIPSKLVRPPMGLLNATIKEKVKSPIVLWDVDVSDTQVRDKEYIKSGLLESIKEGSIVLLHEQCDQTIEALREVLPILKARGFEFVTVNKLHSIYNVKLLPGKVYAKVQLNRY